MPPVIAMFGAGAMGAGLARRLTDSGADVIAALDERSPASRERARLAGMRNVPAQALTQADLTLCVVPPAVAGEVARGFASHLRANPRPALYVDCNAVAPQTTLRIGHGIVEAGARYVDGGIVGGPPRPGYTPRLYVSGAEAAQVTRLNDFGLDVRVLEGAPDAASRLKMSYAGITKGIVAIAATMITGAARAEIAEALRAELADSQSQYLAQFAKSLPGMLPKAARWVAEMEEIARFLEENDPAGARLFHAAAEIYAGIAEEEAQNTGPAEIFRRFFKAL